MSKGNISLGFHFFFPSFLYLFLSFFSFILSLFLSISSSPLVTILFHRHHLELLVLRYTSRCEFFFTCETQAFLPSFKTFLTGQGVRIRISRLSSLAPVSSHNPFWEHSQEQFMGLHMARNRVEYPLLHLCSAFLFQILQDFKHISYWPLEMPELPWSRTNLRSRCKILTTASITPLTPLMLLTLLSPLTPLMPSIAVNVAYWIIIRVGGCI